MVPADEVQQFAEFDEEGRSLKEEWAVIIEDSTKRLGGVEDSRCRVTVTDRFGGRGHDFQVVLLVATCYLLLATGYLLLAPCCLLLAVCCLLLAACCSLLAAFCVLLAACCFLLATCYLLLATCCFQVVDKENNANGGMLVIATSIPDEREWIQWKGRTARQDRPGQYYVILNQQAKPFTLPEFSKLAAKVSKMTSEDDKIEELLGVADAGIGQQLANFKVEQAAGEKLNELTEKYYTQKPRTFDDPWPSKEHNETDLKLRAFLTENVDKSPSDIVKLAKELMDIEITPVAGGWGW